MLVILMNEQLLQPAMVCQSCPMASQSGLPRWHQGRLRCGRLVTNPLDKMDNSLAQSPAQYECAMGFRVAELSDS